MSYDVQCDHLARHFLADYFPKWRVGYAEEVRRLAQHIQDAVEAYDFPPKDVAQREQG